MEVRASQRIFLLGPKKKITLILGKFPRKTSHCRIAESAYLEKKQSEWTTGHTFKSCELQDCSTGGLEGKQLTPEY